MAATGAWQRAAAGVTLLGHFVVAFGLPLPVSRPAKSSAVPFPCQNHPCGCSTSEQCWAGACGCFTMGEKLAWAAEQGFEPPAHARRHAEAEPASCCAPKAGDCCGGHAEAEPARGVVRWVAIVAARQCRGDGPLGLLLAGEPAVPPDLGGALWAPAERAAFPAPGGASAHFTSHPPPIRPPRFG